MYMLGLMALSMVVVGELVWCVTVDSNTKPIHFRLAYGIYCIGPAELLGIQGAESCKELSTVCLVLHLHVHVHVGHLYSLSDPTRCVFFSSIYMCMYCI